MSLKDRLQQDLEKCEIQLNTINDQSKKLNEYKLKLQGGIETLELLDQEKQQQQEVDTRIPLIE